MSMIVGTCSMNTGHSYMQAPQVTQSHIGSKPTPPLSGVGCSRPSAPGARAAAALRGGVRIKHLLPGEAFEPANSEALRLLEVRDRSQDAAGLQAARKHLRRD